MTLAGLETIMLNRATAAALIVFLLSGCVLQSKDPLIADSAADTALAAFGSRFTSYEATSDNGWRKDVDLLVATPKGKHYVFSDGKSDTGIAFLALAKTWWGVQMTEPGKGSVYALAEARAGEVVIRPLACDDMQKAGTYAALVRFEKDDCFVRDGVRIADVFRLAMAHPSPPLMKLVPRH